MNDDQITAISREYAEECAKGFAPADMPNYLRNEATDIVCDILPEIAKEVENG